MNNTFWFFQSISVMINQLLGGQPMQSVCCRLHVARARGNPTATRIANAIDRLDPGHCDASWQWYSRHIDLPWVSQIHHELQLITTNSVNRDNAQQGETQ